MKKLLFLLLFISTLSFSQNKYMTKTGVVNFEASVPSFEEVKAKNSNVTAIINVENGEFAALALVKGFRFKNALMEEHFNENYAESDVYPKAIFKGKIEDFDFNNLNETYTINGSLEFHGIKKQLDGIELKITKENSVLIMNGSFTTKASYFDIKIPKIVKNKIAEDVEVSFAFQLQAK